MVSSLLLGFSVLFFILGHSTLLYFAGKELPSIPLKKLLIPWPKAGRVVSISCYLLSAMFFLLLIAFPLEFNLESTNSRKIFFVFVVMPVAGYSVFVFRRIRKVGRDILFNPSAPGKAEWKFILLIAAVISFVSYVFK